MAATTTLTGSPLPREIAVRYIPVIRQIALRLARRLPAHVCVDDLVGAGFIGLIDAHRRYDPTRCDRFEGYAEFRIRGAMLDELRSYDPLSRDLRSLATRTTAATRKLQGVLGRAPNDAELAAELGLELGAYQGYAAKMAVGRTVSIDAPLSDGEPRLELGDHDATPADETLDLARSKRALSLAVDALPPRLRQVLALYYGDQLTLRDIGGILGVTESRVCQLHADAIKRLRERCREDVVSDTHAAFGAIERTRPVAAAAAAAARTTRRTSSATRAAVRVPARADVAAPRAKRAVAAPDLAAAVRSAH